MTAHIISSFSMDPETYKVWEKIPKWQRSALIREFLRGFKEKSGSPQIIGEILAEIPQKNGGANDRANNESRSFGSTQRNQTTPQTRKHVSSNVSVFLSQLNGKKK